MSTDRPPHDGRRDTREDEVLELARAPRELFARIHRALQRHLRPHTTDGEGPCLTGGGILEARWDHRESRDIDIVIRARTRGDVREALDTGRQRGGRLPGPGAGNRPHRVSRPHEGRARRRLVRQAEPAGRRETGDRRRPEGNRAEQRADHDREAGAPGPALSGARRLRHSRLRHAGSTGARSRGQRAAAGEAEEPDPDLRAVGRHAGRAGRQPRRRPPRVRSHPPPARTSRDRGCHRSPIQTGTNHDERAGRRPSRRLPDNGSPGTAARPERNCWRYSTSAVSTRSSRRMTAIRY